MRVALLSFLAALPASASAKTLECDDLSRLSRYFVVNHYTQNEVTDELRQRSSKLFVESLDRTRSLLLESDARTLQKELESTLAKSTFGGCGALTKALNLVVLRSEEDLGFVRGLLDEDYVLDTEARLELDPEARGWPKKDRDRRELVRRQVHFQVASLVSGGLALEKVKKQLIHRYELALRRAEERRERKKGPEIYAGAFALALDPHSSFLSADDLADFRIQMQLSLEGIGAALRASDGFTFIESLIPGGAAAKTERLQPKDKIIAVAQDGEESVSTIDMDLRDVVKLIRGKKGTNVTLTVLREGKKGKTFDVTITRAKIDVAQAAASIGYETRKVGDKTLKIGVLELPSFYGGRGGRSSYEDVKRLVKEAVDEKVDGLVLDLSRNGGGLLDDAVKISGLFLRRGAVVATKSVRGEVEVLPDADPRIQYAGPLAVMITPVSASGAEILAGALRAYDRAVIVGGPKSFGKGTVQAVLELPAGLGAAKVTTGMFFLPNGSSTQFEGVDADVDVPSLMTGFDIGEQDLDYALPSQELKAFLSEEANRPGPQGWVPVDRGVLERLQSRSKARVSKSEAFEEVREQLEDTKKDDGPISVADLQARSAGEEDEGESSSETATERLDRLQEAFSDEAVDVLVDLIERQPSLRTAGGPRSPTGRGG
ncbi:MAG: S41 family peptidase [Myxococcota bacterium]